jgi:serine/threonine protein kinase
MLTRAQRRDSRRVDTACTEKIVSAGSSSMDAITREIAGPPEAEPTKRSLRSPEDVTAPAGDAHEVKVPGRFGRYVLLERMGEGGMAEVFRAVVPGVQGFRRQVVLKRILSSHASAPTFVGMFAQEARISALLHHPNIVQVLDFGQVDGSYFLAMEFLDGWEIGAINRALRASGAKMPIEIAVHIAHEVLLGLSYAHTLKVEGYQPHIVHRDVSPSNIMCMRAGGVKLLDFGVATATGGQPSSGAAHASFCGKVAYCAPEYALGHGTDARIDLFAVGVVLWEMLAGRRLFREKSDRQTLAAVLGAPIAPPSSSRPAISEEIDRIVMKALERDPERRYQSAEMMAEDLEQVLNAGRYQPQMLPRLLGNLFGEPQTGPLLVTAVEQLMQSGATIPPAMSAAPSPQVFTRRQRALKFLRSKAGAISVTVGAMAMLMFALFQGAGTRAVPPAVHRPAPRASTPEVHAIPRTVFPAMRSPRVPAPSVTSGTPLTPARRWTLAPNPPKRKTTAHKPRATSIDAAGLVSSGRPIDPFAEATSRGPRP